MINKYPISMEFTFIITIERLRNLIPKDTNERQDFSIPKRMDITSRLK